MTVKGEYAGGLAEARAFLESLLGTYHRVAVTGRPGVGKTHVTRGLRFVSTDDLVMGRPWEEQVPLVLEAGSGDSWRLEGITVARALRHGLSPSAVLVLHGPPLRSQMTAAALRLGDQVYKWVDEARRNFNVDFYDWNVRESKRA